MPAFIHCSYFIDVFYSEVQSYRKNYNNIFFLAESFCSRVESFSV